MATARKVDDVELLPDPDMDQRVFLRMDWSAFTRFLKLRGDAAGPRIIYLDGVLELMSPGRTHEGNKTKLARLVERYAEALRIPLEGYGSWTLKDGRKKSGAEPDECYIRDTTGEEDRPDFAVEVVHTSGGLDKLEVYRRLRVREVWNYENNVLQVFALRDGAYVEVGESSVLPELDLGLIARCMLVERQSQAIQALLEAIAKPA